MNPGEQPPFQPQFHTPDSVARARAVFEAALAEAEKVRTRAAEVREASERLEGVATSPENGLKVRVNAQGALTGLEIDPRAYRKLSPAELSDKIMELSRTARTQAQTAMRTLLDDAGLSAPLASRDEVLDMLKGGRL